MLFMRKNRTILILIVGITTLLICGCSTDDGRERLTSSEHSEEVVQATEVKGPHGGKFFEKDGFALEVTIYEPEIPPQSRVYTYENGKPLDPSSVTLVTELHRIDRVDTIHYQKQDDYLIGDKIVEEPHSFDVKLKANYKGKEYTWSYASYEGRTTLSDQAIESSGIKLEKAQGDTISTTVTLNGQIVPDKLKLVKLTARFPGVVKELRKLPGSNVEKGEIIATIEANESLKTYDLLAPRSGEVLDLNTSVGEVVAGRDSLMTIGDLSSVWIELSVPKSDFSKLKVGQKVRLHNDEKNYYGEITYLSSLADGDTQTRLARAEVENPNGSLVPELFVEAEVIVEERNVPVAIKAEALHTFRDWDVVFKKVGQNFEIAILELGQKDGNLIEVKEGLAPGTEYVTENSFVVKADVMKSGATHDH
jgi:membrane fusion protein, heavy metal efflux system